MFLRVGHKALVLVFAAVALVPLVGAWQPLQSPPTVGDGMGEPPVEPKEINVGKMLPGKTGEFTERIIDAVPTKDQIIAQVPPAQAPPVAPPATPGEPTQVLPDEVDEVVDEAVVIASDPVGFADRSTEPARSAAQRLGTRITTMLASDETASAPAAEPAVVESSPAEIPTAAVATVIVAGIVTAGGVMLWFGASTGTVGGAAASGVGAKLAGKDLRNLLPYASPLFTRFERDTVLGHPKREALYALILQTPGVSLQTLCEQTNLSRTAVTHHLRLMELQHLIVSKRHGRSRHYFENGGRYGREQKDAYAVLQNDRTKDVAEFIRKNPGTIQKTLCGSLSIQASIAHWHVKRLTEAGLVQLVRRGRTVAYFPTANLEQASIPAVPAQAAEPLPQPVIQAVAAPVAIHA